MSVDVQVAGKKPATSFIERRAYQERIIDALVQEGGGMVRAPTGAGKSVIALKAAKRMTYKRLLIIVPRYSALVPWKKLHGDMRLNDELVIVEKWKPSQRNDLWETRPEHDQIVVCLINTLKSDLEAMKDAGFDLVIVDEAHKIVRNRRTQNFKMMKKFMRYKRGIYLTATPQSKGPQDLWCALHLLSPGAWPSYWKFVMRYCVVDDEGFGKEIVGVRKSTLAELRSRVSPYVFNIADSELKGYVPERVRQPLYTRMSNRVAKTYRRLAEDLLAELPDGRVIMAANSLAATTRLRQLLVCPMLIHEGLGYGSGIETIFEHMTDNDPHCVIYTPFTEAFPYITKFFKNKGVEDVFHLRGGMSSSELGAVIGQYERKRKSTKPSIALCSISFAESFDLVTPRTGYMLGYDWDQNVNYQAEGRMTRGENKPYCNYFYVVHEDTVDTSMIELLDGKVRRSSVLFPDTASLRTALEAVI